MSTRCSMTYTARWRPTVSFRWPGCVHAHPDNVFVHLVLRTLPGRDPQVKKASTDRLFAAILARFKPLSDRLPIAISMHVEEASPDLGYRLSTYRQHMAARAAAGAAEAQPA
jgi:5-carboxymethyl-2-hydroxymuconate isomerase